MVKRICSVVGCGQPHQGRGYCLTHYNRWKLHGDPLAEVRQHGRQGCTVDRCDASHYAKGLCESHYKKLRKWGDPLAVVKPGSRPGPTHPLWRGDDVGYRAVHNRKSRRDGPASLHSCAHCSGRAAQWAYDHTDPNEARHEERPGVSMPYTFDLDRMIPLCRACHIVFDDHPFVTGFSRWR